MPIILAVLTGNCYMQECKCDLFLGILAPYQWFRSTNDTCFQLELVAIRFSLLPSKQKK